VVSRSGSLKQKYSRLSEVSQLRYRAARLHRLGWAYVAWRADTKSANLAQPCLKLRLQSIAEKCTYEYIHGTYTSKEGQAFLMSSESTVPTSPPPQSFFLLAKTFKTSIKATYIEKNVYESVKRGGHYLCVSFRVDKGGGVWRQF
jgi:hypothetical protein